MRVRVSGISVPCPVCKSPPGARCRYIWHKPNLGSEMPAYHEKRAADAKAAEEMANALVDA